MSSKSKIATYVLMLAEFFPAFHSRKEDKTLFFIKLISGVKKHTIRGNYEWWKKRIDKINAGEAILSVRQWDKEDRDRPRPYHDNQLELLKYTHEDKLTYQHIQIMSNLNIYIDGKKLNVVDELILINNDGLTRRDFYEWFKIYKAPLCKDEVYFDGIIIHFRGLKY